MASVVLLAAGAGLFLFRSKTVDNPSLGLLTYHWKWGRQAELTADVNRDGRVDARVTFAGWGQNFATHVPYRELWESSRCDGVFDRHMTGGEILALGVDTDRDGTFDLHLEGAKAEAFLQEHPADERCRWR